jgi:hypothetical protein
MSQLTSTIIASLHEDVMKAIHEQRYKNGAFIEPIPQRTPIRKANVLPVASPHTASDENTILKKVCGDYAKTARDLSGGDQDAELLAPLMTGAMQELFEMFENMT